MLIANSKVLERAITATNQATYHASVLTLIEKEWLSEQKKSREKEATESDRCALLGQK